MASLADLWNGWRESLRQPPFLVLDAAGLEGGAEAIPRPIFGELECLFTGDLAIELADVAPYLGRLASFDTSVRDAVERLLRDHVGMVVLPCRQPEQPSFAELHRHFRKFNIVYGPEGQPLFFRYYDPRVLPEVLAVLEAPQLRAFFAVLEGLVLDDAQARTVLCHANTGRLSIQT